MNINRLIEMLMRRFLMRGMNRAISHMAGPKKKRRDMTPEERAQADQAQSVNKAAKRARQAQRITRRL